MNNPRPNLTEVKKIMKYEELIEELIEFGFDLDKNSARDLLDALYALSLIKEEENNELLSRTH